MTDSSFQIASGSGNAATSYVQELRAVYAQRRARIPNPSKALRDDASWWTKALRDPVIRKCVQKRNYAVAGREWRVMPATETRPEDQVAAAIVEEALDGIAFFDRSRALLATAIFRGVTYARIYGEKRFVSLGFDVHGKPLPPRTWWVPTLLEDVDPLRFEKRWDAEQERYRWFFGSVKDPSAAGASPDFWEPLEHPEWFVRNEHEPTEGSLDYGQPLMDALEFSLWAKQELWRVLISGARRAGKGFLKVATDDVRAGGTEAERAQNVEDWKAVLEIAHEDGDLIHSKDDEVELLPVPSEGLAIVRQAIQDCNEDMTALILFGVLPTGGASGGNGSYARAEVEDGQGADAFHFNQAELSESITHTLVELFWRLNKKNLASVGLGAARRPRFEIVNEARSDPKTAVEVVKGLREAGAEVREDEVLERVGGYTPPKPGERTLGAPQVVQPPASPAVASPVAPTP